MNTYLDVIDALATAGDEVGLTFVGSDGTSERTLGWRTLHRELTARGRQLLASGVSFVRMCSST